jgi:hypothetical protein
MDTILKNAEDKKFTDFSKAVKQELANKLSNHPISKSFASDYDKIQSMKAAFAKINTDNTPAELDNVPDNEPSDEE